MSRYIDADEAKKSVKENYWSYPVVPIAVGHIIDRVPTADVAPVIHGHWIPKKEMIRSPEAKNYNCSACGKESFAYPNCPFCRAIMDEEVKEK